MGRLLNINDKFKQLAYEQVNSKYLNVTFLSDVFFILRRERRNILRWEGRLTMLKLRKFIKQLGWTDIEYICCYSIGILFILIYSVINTLLYNMNYRRMNRNKNMNRKMIMINLILHGVIALIMVSVAIYLSYFK